MKKDSEEPGRLSVDPQVLWNESCLEAGFEKSTPKNDINCVSLSRDEV